MSEPLSGPDVVDPEHAAVAAPTRDESLDANLAPHALANGIADISLDSQNGTTEEVYQNGDSYPEEKVPPEEGMQDDERIRELSNELLLVSQEREQFKAQYTSLLAKLTTMRNTLGDKLKQDADELDRREQEISELRAANEDLAQSVETLRSELIQSHEDGENIHTELEQLRQVAYNSQQHTSEEATERELLLREAQDQVEQIRLQRDDWENEAMRGKVKSDSLNLRVEKLEMELGQTKIDKELLREERDREAESAVNLQTVLHEFQMNQEKELESSSRELQAELNLTSENLAAWKQRAIQAETRLAGAQDDSQKVLALTKEVKDQHLLTGKLRHEAVILNEHLTEALRRLKKDSNENSVDRRLISNVFISFLNTPRGDTKRFEMLSLISSILSWNDDQREQVGLQRATGLSAPGIISSGSRGNAKGHARSGKGKQVEESAESESFSNLWIEFLLKEANSGTGTKNSSGVSSPLKTPPASPRALGNVPPPLSPTLSDLGTSAAGTPPAQTSRRPTFTSIFGAGRKNPAPENSASGKATPPSILEER